MAEPVHLPPATFEIGRLDYLADTDGDGVGDYADTNADRRRR